MESNTHLITPSQLKTLIDNQGKFKKFYVELGENVRINFKNIRPRKRKSDKLPNGIIVIRKNVVLDFD